MSRPSLFSGTGLCFPWWRFTVSGSFGPSYSLLDLLFVRALFHRQAARVLDVLTCFASIPTTMIYTSAPWVFATLITFIFSAFTRKPHVLATLLTLPITTSDPPSLPALSDQRQPWHLPWRFLESFPIASAWVRKTLGDRQHSRRTLIPIIAGSLSSPPTLRAEISNQSLQFIP